MKKHMLLKLVIVIGGIFLIYQLVTKLPTLQVKSSPLPEFSKTGITEGLGNIDLNLGKVLVAETDSKKLFLDTTTLNLTVEDKASGRTWNALHPSGTEDERSLLKITFIGEDNTTVTWDAYTYTVKGQTYTVEQIKNGVRMNLTVKESDSFRLNEYMPQKISIERYETFFLEGLSEKEASGELSQELADKYRVTLSLVYAKDEEKGYYYNRYASAPPLSAVTQLIEVTKLLGYTTEQLIEDNAEFGISSTIEEPAEFMIPVEATLENDDFVVQIATDEIQVQNNYYTLTNIDVLPWFGSVSPKEVEEGYIFVPDGTGALMELNQFNSNYGGYSRELYKNTWFNDFYYLSSYPESLSMPVFGMIYGKEETATGGFLGIIEKGDDTGFIRAALASAAEGGGGNYNKVHAGIDVAQFAQVSILGPYDTSGGRFISSTGMMDIDITIRYKLYSEPVTYFDMAQTYRQYLIERYGLTPVYEDRAKLYLEVVGALTIEKRLLGLPYDKVISMTTYQELQDILNDLKEIPLVVSYQGVFNKGLNHKLMNRADLTKENGSKKELEELLKTAKENEQELFFQADFSKIYKGGNGFSEEKHAIYNFTNEPVQAYGYNRANGMLWGISDFYYFLNPRYLSSVVDNFLKEAAEYERLAIGDLASDFYGNYEKGKIVTPRQAQEYINSNLEKLSKDKTLALNNPRMDKLAYGKYAVNISRESSGYGGLAEEIPFRQLVMNGLISYTTLNVNEAESRKEYFLLQALELGSFPKFVVTAKNLDLIKNSYYTDFISRQYSIISEDIKKLYQAYEEAFAQINCMEITGHSIRQENVFETLYANGVRVITNYNKFPVEIDGIRLDALGYYIQH